MRRVRGQPGEHDHEIKDQGGDEDLPRLHGANPACQPLRKAGRRPFWHGSRHQAAVLIAHGFKGNGYFFASLQVERKLDMHALGKLVFFRRGRLGHEKII